MDVIHWYAVVSSVVASTAVLVAVWAFWRALELAREAEAAEYRAEIAERERDRERKANEPLRHQIAELSMLLECADERQLQAWHRALDQRRAECGHAPDPKPEGTGSGNEKTGSGNWTDLWSNLSEEDRAYLKRWAR